MPNFRAVVFDLFDTLVDFNPELIPVVEINGKSERTTSINAYEALVENDYPVPSYEEFHRHWIETSKEVWGERDRDPDHREVTSRARFMKFTERLDSLPSEQREAAAVVAMETHMERLISSTDFDEARLAMLGQIREASLRVGLISNFDNTEAAHRLLGRTGIDAYLEATLVSGEVGYRKPASRLYLQVADVLGVAPGEVLFVGDNFECDVLGPRSVGMPSAWLNPNGGPPPDGAAPPDYEIKNLLDVLKILNLDA
ncbi:MAG: HAD family hydrolase [Nitrospinaceae bacterium]|nr:HAD family hydrolase [Nitrospinaceae bacterium]MBT3433692.1 HAD family hydrolase [Nitrospinaceae bacterium]MBT3821478.1 HAD family hydrolase [Nitrospinaceae bacterium]MBT4431764.1 HAD family hydrolase [Nitrospinaceae bacterium]MBT5369258.1 HAD family hydrolase [Nitrospinaceae bacterium]